MRQMQSVLWSKGVLLTPQHLQTQDRFIEDLLDFQLSSLAFCPWGFSRLELDREALAGGVLAIAGASGIMQDGLIFEIPESDSPPAPKPLEDHWIEDEDTLDVLLAIPEHRVGGYNVSLADQARTTRYLAEVSLRRDENTGREEKPIQVARKNFHLLTEGESLEGFSTMTVARVQRTAAGDFQLVETFVPPLLDISASEYVLSIARRLVEILATRSSLLSGTRRQRDQSLADFGVSDVANFWLLYTVNTHLPELRHLYETRRGHPGALFEAMLALAGSLTTFSRTIEVRDLPAYDHADLAGCLTELDQKVRELLETVVPANHVALPLKEVRPSVQATAIDDDRYLAAPQILLAIRAGVTKDQLISGAQQLKVSSPDRVERLISRALPGVKLAHSPTPPRAVPVKLDYEYFRVERSGDDWDAVRTARKLAVYVPSDLPDAEMELIIVLPEDD